MTASGEHVEFRPLHVTDIERHLGKALWLIGKGRGVQKEHAPIVVEALARSCLYWMDRAEEAALRSIEASNPGIDMDEVRRSRATHSGRRPNDG